MSVTLALIAFGYGLFLKYSNKPETLESKGHSSELVKHTDDSTPLKDRTLRVAEPD
ncbi:MULTISPECIES: hypothetical protein [Roseivirga]|uniref:hypothetical protein n=1 Tax=Roseivirga TaxID=290180 RepID=UPI001671E76F|nr:MULTISPECIES: hypothetical protein [Roseivirga]MEC7753870.1 hypothetical protein [Bacteroidota bacterium]